MTLTKKPIPSGEARLLASAAKDYPPSSPTDALLSPCSKKLRRKQSRKISENTALEFWVPPDDTEIVLGSSSSSRQEILHQLGWQFRVISPDIDELAVKCSDPFRLPVMIAKAKATAIISKLGSSASSPTIVITCDQIVIFRNEVRNKPISKDQAREFLLSYQDGEVVQTISAVVATHLPSGRQSSDIDISTIHWGGISPEVAEELLKKPDVFNSAGGFLIEDPDFVNCVDRIEGELDSIRGLPVKQLKKVMRAVVSTDI